MKLPFRTLHVQAACLMRNDLFRMGGTLYRVIEVKTNHYGNPVVEFAPARHKRIRYTHTLIIDKKTRFKVYYRK